MVGAQSPSCLVFFAVFRPETRVGPTWRGLLELGPAEGEGIRGWSVGLDGMDPEVPRRRLLLLVTSSLSRRNRETRGWAMGVNSSPVRSERDLPSFPPAVLWSWIVARLPRFCEVAVAFRWCRVALRALAQPYYWALASRRRPPARHNNAMLVYGLDWFQFHPGHR